MKKRFLTLNDALKKELKDEEFRKCYEEEGKRLNLGYKIAKLRETLGLTQSQLAQKVHTSQAAIARLENGNYSGYTLKTLEKIAAATGTHLEIQFK